MGRMGAAAVLAVLVVVMVGTASVVDAQCTGSLSGLTPCYSAVMMNGGGAPSPQCCSTVSSMGLPCICATLTQYADKMPPSVDINKILTLPSKCGLTVTPGYQCAGYTIPS